jgi:hypothetical protein
MVGLTLACTDGTGPRPQAGGIRFVRGNASTDTVDATLAQPLIIEVRDSTGKLAPLGTIVQFSAIVQDEGPYWTTWEALLQGFSSTVFDRLATGTTDAAGRTGVTVKLGIRTGTAHVAITVPTLGISDTATFTVNPGAASGVRVTPSDTTLYVAKTYQLTGGVSDRYGNIRTDPVVWSSAEAQVSSSGVVTTTEVGRFAITVTAGSAQATGYVTVVPPGRVVARQGQSIVAFDLDGSNFQTIVTTTSTSRPRYPRWIPNSNTVLYVSDPIYDSTDPIQLMTISADGAIAALLNPKPASMTGVGEPMPSAQGNWMYFGAYDTGCSTFLFCMYRAHTDGTGAQLLTIAQQQGGTAFSPAPSPDGGKVAFVTDSSGYSVIRILDVATNTLEPSITLGVNPSWSPDGAHIAYLSSFDGTLLMMNADGSNSHAVPPGKLYNRQPIVWSPDSEWLMLMDYFSFGLEIVNVHTGAVLPLAYTASVDMDTPSWK